MCLHILNTRSPHAHFTISWTLFSFFFRLNWIIGIIYLNVVSNTQKNSSNWGGNDILLCVGEFKKLTNFKHEQKSGMNHVALFFPLYFWKFNLNSINVNFNSTSLFSDDTFGSEYFKITANVFNRIIICEQYQRNSSCLASIVPETSSHLQIIASIEIAVWNWIEFNWY